MKRWLMPIIWGSLTFVLVYCLLVAGLFGELYVGNLNRQEDQFNATVTVIMKTNQWVETAIAATQTAKTK